MKFRFGSGLMSVRDRLRRAKAQRAQRPTPGPEAEANAAQALASQRGRPTWSPPPNAGKIAAALMRPLLPKGSMGLSQVQRRWSEIVGPQFADKTAPEKLAGGVLTLRAPSAAAPFLQQQIPLLLERLRLAGAQVSAIRLEQRANAPAKAANVRPLRRRLEPRDDAALAQALDHIADPSLKSALLRLGRAVKQG